MNKREIDDLARAVIEQLEHSDPTSSPHQSPDVGWRMPLGTLGGAVDERADGQQLVGRRMEVSRDVPPTFPPSRRVADLVDHTLLKPEATRRELDRLCDEAVLHGFAAVCVHGAWVSRCVRRLRDSDVMVATVAGFPHGAMTSAAKAFEVKELVERGADEVDVVASIGHILDESWDYVEDDLRAVVQSASGRAVKVILETALLDPVQIVKSAALAKECGARFVKTSTGFHPAGGATVEAVALMRAAVGNDVGVKAAGGVRDCATALRMMVAGATRIGTSSGVSFAECMGPDPLPLAELDPDRHETACRLAVGR